MKKSEAQIKEEYSVVAASACEVGLLYKDTGVRTWFNSEFSGMPDLNHPKIRRAIEINEADLELKAAMQKQPPASLQ